MDTKKVMQLLLLTFNALVAFFFISIGTQGTSFTDGEPQHSAIWVDIVVLLIFTTLVFLWLLGRTRKQAEQAFWFLGIAYLPLIVLLLFLFPYK